MFEVIKKAGKEVAAYRLGDTNEVLTRLEDEGKIVRTGEDDYEIFSEEVCCGQSGKGELAHSGDYIKLSSSGYPYPNNKEFFLKNHRKIAEDLYEQIPKPLLAWDVSEPMCGEMEFLIREKGLVINEDDPEKYFSAMLWGTREAAPRDAVIVFYSVTRDGKGNISDADFNFVTRGEFERTYNINR